MSRRLEQVLKAIPQDWMSILYSDEEHRVGRVNQSSKKLLDRILIDLDDISDDILCPEPSKWLEFARLTPLEKIRVIIIGQDPYHTKKNKVCNAHGLAFSCLGGTIPPSLRNIYKCLENRGLSKDQKHIGSGDLTPWARQGVLLLNYALSTEVSMPNQHYNIWSTYVEFIIQRLCENAFSEHNQLMFLLWGKNAQKLSKLIDSDFHILKVWSHPSPMAQASIPENEKFINCDHFDEANSFLEDWDCEPINWAIENPIESDIDEDVLNEMNSEIKVNTNLDVKYAEIKPINTNKEVKQVDVDAVTKVEEKPIDSSWFNGNKSKIIVFTDGSCHPNKKTPKARGGYAASFVQGPFKDTVIYGNLCIQKNHATNIRAEGQAILSTLEFIKAHITDWYECVIVTDCEFWINMINKYMPKWSDEKFNEKSNSDMTLSIWNLWKSIMACDKELSVFHVRSHNKSGWKDSKNGTFEKYCYEQNDYVDKLCGYARKTLNPGENIISIAEYE